MGSTFFGLNIGTSGLYAYQAGLNTTAHNIANAEVDGYTKQVMGQTASDAIHVNATYGMAGTGVVVTGVEQIRNEYYDVKFRNNSTLEGEYSTKGHYMKEVENYFNEVNVEGFTKIFTNFNNSLGELAKDPSNLSVRTQVTNYAKSFTEYFNYMANSMKSIQSEANFEMKNKVDQINSISKQVAALTKQINALEVRGGTANDLRDARNLLIDELSGIVSVSVEEKLVGDGVGINQYVVMIDGQLLVDTSDAKQLTLVPREEKLNLDDVEGLYDVVWDNGQELNLSSSSLGGTLQAISQVRDGNNEENLQGVATAVKGEKTLTLTKTNINDINKLNIPESGQLTVGNNLYSYSGFTVAVDATTGEYTYNFTLTSEVVKDANKVATKIGESVDYKGIPFYMAKMNEFVRTYAMNFNEIHNQGKDLNGNAGLDVFNGTDAVTGKNFVLEEKFTGFDSVKDSYYKVTASNFTVNAEVQKSPSLIAASTDSSSGVENNNIIDKLVALKTDKSMFRQGAPASFLQTLVAEVGINSKKAISFSENQENILKSISNQRLSLSGVDMDEEAMNLVRFKNAYNLSAKVISVMDEIYNKLINEMGV